MTTWISRQALLAAALLGLGACTDLPTSGLLTGLGGGGTTMTDVALSETQMANGSFTLVPPQGFCIDRKTLRQNFALLARCDVLGAPSLSAGAPVGLITVSVTDLDENAPLPTPQDVADAQKLARISAETSENRAITFRAEGVPPASGLDVIHWRGLARLGGAMMGIALYGPEGARAVSSEGREIINGLIRRTRERS